MTLNDFSWTDITTYLLSVKILCDIFDKISRVNNMILMSIIHEHHHPYLLSHCAFRKERKKREGLSARGIYKIRPLVSGHPVRPWPWSFCQRNTNMVIQSLFSFICRITNITQLYSYYTHALYIFFYCCNKIRSNKTKLLKLSASHIF